MQVSECVQIRAEANAASNVYAALAAAFASEPCAEAVEGIAAVAGVLGVPWAEEVCIDSLRDRYVELFIVPRSACYVPLSENCIRAAADKDGVFAFCQVDGPYREHVSKCYAAAGFVRPAGIAHDDSLAAELSFMAFLAAAQFEAETEKAATCALDWQHRFLCDHLLAWVRKASEAILRVDDGYYARVAMLVAAWCETDAERVKGLIDVRQ